MDFDLDVLVEALSASERTCRRDENGDWRIEGKGGHIYAQPEGFYLYCTTTSKQAWTWAKKALAFCKVTQDGDDEGFLLLDRLPDPVEAEVIRDKLGIRKKREVSDAEKERLAGMGARFGKKPVSEG